MGVEEKKERLKRLAGNDQFISGIYNYCDRWYSVARDSIIRSLGNSGYEEKRNGVAQGYSVFTDGAVL